MPPASVILAVVVAFLKEHIQAIGIVLLALVAFCEGCSCERHHLKTRAQLPEIHNGLHSAPPLVAETPEPPLAKLPVGEPVKAEPKAESKVYAVVQPRGLGLGVLPPKVTLVNKTYSDATAVSQSSGVPVVAFVGVPVRPVRDAVACAVGVGERIGDVVLSDKPGIVVCYPGSVYRLDVIPTVDDDQLAYTVRQVRSFRGASYTTYSFQQNCPSGRCPQR